MAKGLNYLTTKVSIIPLADVTSLSGPKVSEWVTSGDAFSLEPFLLPSSKLPSFGADKTIVQMGITESIEVKALTGSESGDWELDFFRDFDAVTGLYSADDLAANVFTDAGLAWAILVRQGLPHDTELAIGHIVDVYTCVSGQARKNREFEGYFRATVSLFNSSQPFQDVTMVA